MKKHILALLTALSLSGPALAVTNASYPSPTLNNVTVVGAGTFGGKSVSDPTLMGFITANETMTVCASGCQYTDPLVAFNAAIGTARFNPNTLITLQIGDGTYTVTNQFYTECACGHFLNIIGDTANPAAVVLNFTNIAGDNFGGFVATAGGNIGLIDGMTLNGVGAIASETATDTYWVPQSYGGGISASAGAYIGLGPHMFINHFYYSVVADNSAIVNAWQGGVTATDAGDVNFMARGNGTIICNNCHAIRAVDTTPAQVAAGGALGENYDSERGGSMYIDGSTGSSSHNSCVWALTNGKAWAHAVTCSGGLGGNGNGYGAITGGSIEATGATITGYAYGAYAAAGGVLDLSAVHISNSSLDGILSSPGGYINLSGTSVAGTTSGDQVVADSGQISGYNLTVTNTASGKFSLHSLHGGNMTVSNSCATVAGCPGSMIASDPAGSSSYTPSGGTATAIPGASYAASSLYLN